MTNLSKTSESRLARIRSRMRSLVCRNSLALSVSVWLSSAFPPAALSQDIVEDMKKQIGGGLDIGATIILIIAILAGAVMVIVTGYQLFREREGLARFGLAVLVAIVMIGMATYLVGESDNYIAALTGKSSN